MKPTPLARSVDALARRDAAEERRRIDAIVQETLEHLHEAEQEAHARASVACWATAALCMAAAAGLWWWQFRGLDALEPAIRWALGMPG